MFSPFSRLHAASSRFFQQRLSALTHSDFRWYWIGQCVSMTGRWMQTMALAWLMLSLTPSPLWFGVAGCVQFLPMLLLTLPAGAIIDRVPTRRILLVTQYFNLAVGLLAGVLSLTGGLNFPALLTLAVLLSCGAAVDMPARQAFFVDLVGVQDLRNAVAINSATFNAARMAGPAIAGLAMKCAGAGWCLVISALTVIPVLISLFKIGPRPALPASAAQSAPAPQPAREAAGSTIQPVAGPDQNESMESPDQPPRHGSLATLLRETGEGLNYILHEPLLFLTALAAFIIVTMIGNHSVLIPLLARDHLHLSEGGYGMLMSCQGLGAVFGALITAVSSHMITNRKIFWASGLLACAATAATGLETAPHACALTLVLIGFLFTAFTNVTNATLQIHADEAHRGRAVSMFILIYSGTAPLGSLITGALARLFGAGGGWAACGVGGVALALAGREFARRLSRRLKASS